jgi:hypothetical protein
MFVSACLGDPANACSPVRTGDTFGLTHLPLAVRYPAVAVVGSPVYLFGVLESGSE